MPELSRFQGVIVTMYYDDHAPPHFHVRCGKQRAQLRLDDLSIAAGSLRPRVHKLIVEWAIQHREELRANWELARRQEPLIPIAPLE